MLHDALPLRVISFIIGHRFIVLSNVFDYGTQHQHSFWMQRLQMMLSLHVDCSRKLLMFGLIEVDYFLPHGT